MDLLIDVTNIYVTNAIHVIFHNSNCEIYFLMIYGTLFFDRSLKVKYHF